ncbi:hypothetical protein PINS_up011149 [Pythium insidiosum]|nr:hypothetical protein PINS_up011149 [Pythium insidiosum]
MSDIESNPVSTETASVQDKTSRKRKKDAVLSTKKLEEYRERAAKRGVVYISRVPPFMKPEKLKHLLGQYGAINRVYLVPEDKAQQKRRVAAGGNRKTKYTEGWIEFEDKKVAKSVAAMLNTKQIGGRKRDYYHDDMWNLKYLKGFKWDHLTEKIAYENRIREQKLRMEIAQAKKENDAYLERVEQSKQFQKMEERKSATSKGAEESSVRRTFMQKAPANSKDIETLKTAGRDDDGLLTRVFAKKRKTT